MIKVKSIYAKAHSDDGQRVLVDLFWPEGLKTREAAVHRWVSELGPSYDLQRFDFDVNNWEVYKEKYQDEVLSTGEKSQLLDEIMEEARKQTVTLLYGNRDSEHNHAAILKELIDSRKKNKK